MAGFDLAFLLGLDDSDFRAKMRDSENEVSHMAGRIGGAIRAQTVGLSKLTGAITSAVGSVTGLFAVVGTITGLLYAGYRLIDSWANESERAAEAAAKELAKRREILHTIESTLTNRRGAAGIISQDDVAAFSVRNEFDDIRKKLEAEFKYNELLKERETLLRDEAKAREQSIAAGFGVGASGGGERPENSRLAEIAPQLEEYERRITEVNEIEAAVLENIRQQSALRAQSLEYQLQTRLQAVAGNQAEADRVSELARHEETLRRIAEIALVDAERAENLRDLEGDLHENRLRQIEEEEAARRQAAEAQEQQKAEQAKRDAERARQLEFENDLFEERQKLERLRLSDQKEAAEALELELEHRRNIQEIQRREGLEEAERARLQRNEEELFELRKQRLVNQPPESLRSIGFGGGFGDALLARQVLGARGDDPQRAIKTNTDKILDQVRDAVESLREIGRNFTIGLV